MTAENNDHMNDDARMVLDAAERILREQCTKELVDDVEAGVWPTRLWDTLEQTGLPRACAPERLGGAGLTLAQGMGLLRLVGVHAVPVPLAETLVASALLGESDCEALPDGPLALAVAGPGDRLEVLEGADGVTVSGEIAGIALPAAVRTLILALPAPGGSLLAVLDRSTLALTPGRSIAGEPVADLVLDAVVVPAAQLHHLPLAVDLILARMALTRALMISGAMQSILDMACAYARDRTQFGRPIAAFQAVQQQLAVLAGDAAAAIRAADRALEALDGPDELIEIAVAKARAGEAAGRGAEIAHQVHGAMGFTYEHALHQRTRRLWAWRDDHGHEAWWQALVGRSLCAAGADGLWGFLTRSA